MRPISTTTHGIMDYMMGILLIAGPSLFDLGGNGLDSLVLFVLGGTTLIYSLITNYELGMVKLLPIRVHLVLDMLSGIALAASPWLLGFADKVFLPHFILGVIEVIVVLMTNPNKKVLSN